MNSRFTAEPPQEASSANSGVIASPAAPVVVIGAGPAGLTAALELVARGVPVVVLERAPHIGGLARTVLHGDCRFDVGGHRFFTRADRVRRLWAELLGEELLVRQRRSRILHRGQFFDYPLRPLAALRQLGPLESVRVAASYLHARLALAGEEASLADWVTHRFGRRLYETFFRSYSEKVWGVPGSEISARWAGQRIGGLSLPGAVLGRLLGGAGPAPRTLTGEFLYPRLGPGMMWDALRARIEAGGGRVLLEHEVTGLRVEAGRVTAVEARAGTAVVQQPAAHVLSTMPVGELVRAIAPAAPPEVVAAARTLGHRDFLNVALVLDTPGLFPDHWLYIHDESVRVARIQNYGNWSRALVPDPGRSCLGMEYFCFAGDDLWSMTDQALLARAADELASLGLAPRGRVVDGVVVRVRQAYPIYGAGHVQTLDLIRRHTAGIHNLQLLGRNGMHRYNNMDHSMLTALLAVENLLGARHDLWTVDPDADSGAGAAQPPDRAADDTAC